ncbi:MAG TPA: trypsin-like peptidase domain-containing protein [Candidatus Andersenbacteria bacterium]|nr:trypsin-like peptidase domain-containing protein [Candidatus Andersenbacteria bacterium]
MQQKHLFIINTLSGAAAGAIISLLILQYPAGLHKIFPRLSVPASTNTQIISPNGTVISDSREQQIISTVQQSQKAVVSIVISQNVPQYEQSFMQPDPFGDFFGNNFPPFAIPAPQVQQRGMQKQEIGGGSGFIVSGDGLIITNKHVVEQDVADYTVFLNDGTEYSAKVIAKDPVNDIAVIKIDAHNLPFLQFADSNSLQVGQTAIAIGNALGEFRNTVSTGVVSGLSRSITAGDDLGQPEQLDEVIQTDAAINPGNSGGPLLNLGGYVIGVNVAIAQGSQNIGFALPANIVKNVVTSVEKTGKISRAYLGVRYSDITPEIQKANNLSVDYGVLVMRGQNPQDLAVIPGSPANKAGIVEGDIILQVDGVKLDSNTSLASLIAKKQPGDSVQLTILSKGQQKTVKVTLEELKS